MKLQIGQTVYHVVEAFKPEYHFRIAKYESAPYEVIAWQPLPEPYKESEG